MHIVAFDIPYPPNYGGVIDIYYKLKALKKCGLQIILHCFSKNRQPADELSNLCKQVHYYQREMNPYLVFSKKPFIVCSRKKPSLLDILLRDNHPVLFEGLHTTYFLKALKKAGKKCFVRTHNVEHHYYRNLAEAERSVFRREFFKIEARKLKKYEPVLAEANGLIAISEEDENYFKEINESTVYIPPFHPEPHALESDSEEKYALYHGNLEVAENKRAVEFLLNQVLSGLEIKLVIAGKGARSLSKSHNDRNVVFIESPTESEMLKWASEASMHLLPTFQSTGFKLKLLYSIYTAKSIVANDEMIRGTGMESAVTLANSQTEWKDSIQSILKNSESQPIISRMKELRDEISNAALAEKLIRFLR